MSIDKDRSVTPPSSSSSAADVAQFIRRAKTLAPRTGRGRLLFALDATASRQPSWDRACKLHGEMFIAAANGGPDRQLSVQLLWYRGFAEFYAAPWADDAASLLSQMNQVRCAGGMTQIERVLQHALQATRKQRLHALVFVGDSMEETPGRLYPLAGQLKLLGLPVFMFQEGNDSQAASSYREIASLSGGAYCAFDAGSADQLRELLRAVAIYASGGQRALKDFSSRSRSAALLNRQLDQRTNT